ncbi:MAG: hypothetical protein WCI96_14520, partial [Planctomycetota bacterium]
PLCALFAAKQHAVRALLAIAMDAPSCRLDDRPAEFILVLSIHGAARPRVDRGDSPREPRRKWIQPDDQPSVA